MEFNAIIREKNMGERDGRVGVGKRKKDNSPFDLISLK